jgi:flagellum-specific peptidoglycan hydrolase FlgJ
LLTQVQVKALEQATAAARASQAVTGCPCELTVAQWALESGWGAHVPAGSNNPFGIKALNGQPAVSIETTEYVGGIPRRMVQSFRAFASLDDAFIEHSKLITSGRPYAAAWSRFLVDRSVTGLIRGVGAVYSTSPMYATQLLSLLSMPAVNVALAGVQSRIWEGSD